MISDTFFKLQNLFAKNLSKPVDLRLSSCTVQQTLPILRLEQQRLRKWGLICFISTVVGAHCYAGYNPCVPSPCENQGQCVRTGEKHDTFTCNCPIQWTGKLCNVQRSPCEVASQKLANADLQDLFGTHKKDNYTSFDGDNITRSVSVCKNGGICVDLMEDFKFICNCTSGWKGELCTIPDVKPF